VTIRHAAPSGPRPARHSRSARTHHALRGAALVATAVLAFGVAGGAAAYTRLQGNIKSADVTSLLGARPTQAPPANPNDPSAGRAVNIVLIGSDTRSGQDAAIGGAVAGMRSDTTIVLHISADRTRVEAVSIPRDSMVQIPACQRSNGTTSAANYGMFNSAFSLGSQSGKVSDAAACTIKTIEHTTHVFIDHYVVIDFAGFISMINALGGVPICIPQAINSPEAGLKVSAGLQTLDGTTALAYARARYGVGDGSDTSRIFRQQRLLAATVQAVRTKNLLTDVPQLIQFLNAATSSVTADPGLASIPSMSGLAFSLKGVNLGNINFMTIPFGADPTDPNRVVWTKAAAAIWAKVANDQPLTASTTPTTAATPTTGTTTAPGTASTAPAAPAAPVSSPPANTNGQSMSAASATAGTCTP
jgi:LCP family protein required for cell wall assembly